MDHKVVGNTSFKIADRGGGVRFRTADEAPMNQALRWVDSDVTKRAVDIIGASCILLFVMPVFLLIVAVIALAGDGPIFFAHQRVGRNGVAFRCLKFRTMRTDADYVLARHLAECPAARREWAQTRKLRNDPRVLAIGRLLRRSSLDELPQLINVLRGEMSLVGPRPIVDDEAPNYGVDFAYYLVLRPGITGLWQISGRNDTTYAERVAFDVRYVRERSLIGDVGILLRTIVVVVNGRGVH